MRRSTSLAAWALATLALGGCTKPESAAAPPPAVAAAAAPAPAAPRQPLQACVMATAAEMSAILGGAVVGAGDDRFNGQTSCIYSPASGISPYAELKVEWGSGEGAMMAMGMMGRIEPGITNPLEGLGDQAAQVGPALMIRTGEDLVTIVLSGVDDPVAKARAIFATVKPRL